MTIASRNFRGLVQPRWDQGFHACVGLDTDFDKIPEKHRIPGSGLSKWAVEETVVQYNRSIITATRDIVACYKPNRAFYAKHGIPGHYALNRTVGLIRELAPEIPVIVDGKWGDIGATDEAYRDEALGFGADAVTLSPYMGEVDSLDRFFAVEGWGCFVLCMTSSKGSGEIQRMDVSGDMVPGGYMQLYQYVAHRVVDWQTRSAATLGLVVGATAPQELVEIRKLVGYDMMLLIPGAGKQGGDEAVCARIARRNFLINNSSKCIFASEGSDYPDAARSVVLQMNKKIHAGLTAA